MYKDKKNTEQVTGWTKEEGFYGKTCNYAFPSSKEGYAVFFLEDGMAENQAYFDNLDSCILWGAYQMLEQEAADVESGNMLICEAGSMRPVMWVTSQDTLLEYAWMTLTNVNIDEEECNGTGSSSLKGHIGKRSGTGLTGITAKALGSW